MVSILLKAKATEQLVFHHSPTFKGYKIDTFKEYKIHTFKGYKILTLKGYKIDEIRQDEGISQCWPTCLYHLRSTCCFEA